MFSLCSIALRNYICNSSTDSELQYLHNTISSEIQTRKDKNNVIYEIEKALSEYKNINFSPLKDIIIKLTKEQKHIYCGDYHDIIVYQYYIHLVTNMNLYINIEEDIDFNDTILKFKILLNGVSLGYGKRINSKNYIIYMNKEVLHNFLNEEILKIFPIFIITYINNKYVTDIIIN